MLPEKEKKKKKKLYLFPNDKITPLTPAGKHAILNKLSDLSPIPRV